MPQRIDRLGFGPEARVKRWGKSPPAVRVTGSAWKTPPGARPSSRQRMARPRPAGRSLEARGNAGPREMVATVFDGTEPGVQTGSSVLISLRARLTEQHQRFNRLSSPSPRRIARMCRAPCHSKDELSAEKRAEWSSPSGPGRGSQRAWRGWHSQCP